MTPVIARLHREVVKNIGGEQTLEIARNACVAGASITSAAVAVAAYCESPIVGIPALRRCLDALNEPPRSLQQWCTRFRTLRRNRGTSSLHAPGFGAVSMPQAARVRSACRRLLAIQSLERRECLTAFYLDNHARIDSSCGALNAIGLMALVFADEQVRIERAERYLVLWQVERALFAAQRIRCLGTRRFPLLSEWYHYEGDWPDRDSAEARDYCREIGLTGRDP